MRLSTWERRLQDYFASVHDAPHRYGSNDCILHCAGAVEAVTGEDRAADHRGKYETSLGAIKHLKGMGFDSPAALVDSMFDEIPIGFAQRGDIVLVPGDGGWDIPAVCDGGIALVVGEDETRSGLFRIPREEWLKAWKIG